MRCINGTRIQLYDHPLIQFNLACLRSTPEFSPELFFALLFTFHYTCSLCHFPAAAKSLQSCPTLCDPIESSPPGSPVPGILQARTLEWVAISFSNAWKWKVKVKSLCRIQLLATPWTAAYQAPPSIGFSRQEYWSGLPLPSPLSYLSLFSQLEMLFLQLLQIANSHCIWYIRKKKRKSGDFLGGPVVKTSPFDAGGAG